MQNGGEGLPMFILAGQCLLVKMLILEPHGIFKSFFAYYKKRTYYNIIETQVCKTMISFAKCITTHFRTEPISERLC